MWTQMKGSITDIELWFLTSLKVNKWLLPSVISKMSTCLFILNWLIDQGSINSVLHQVWCSLAFLVYLRREISVFHRQNDFLTCFDLISATKPKSLVLHCHLVSVATGNNKCWKSRPRTHLHLLFIVHISLVWNCIKIIHQLRFEDKTKVLF